MLPTSPVPCKPCLPGVIATFPHPSSSFIVHHVLDGRIPYLLPNVQKQGYVDPATKEVRRIPFEIMVTGDKEPVYEENLEDLGRFKEQPVLPFNAYGSMALARSEFETNSGSSQIFWLLKASVHELLAPGGGEQGMLLVLRHSWERPQS